MNNKHTILKKASFFKDLTENQINLLKNIDVVEFANKQPIFFNGDVNSYVYIILEGWVKEFRTSINGDEFVLSVVNSGNIVGNYFSSENVAQKVSAQAVSPVKLLKIPHSSIINAIKQDTSILDVFLNINSQKQQLLLSEMENLVVCSAPKKIIKFILNLSGNKSLVSVATDGSTTVKLPYSKNLIASQLGMQAETFSRAFASLKNSNLIEAYKRNIVIKNPNELELVLRK